MRVGYVIHTYPAVSHAFIQREVLGLRQAGIEVHTLSVHRAEGEHVLSEADRAEAASTATIFPVSVPRLAAAHLRALRHPSAYWRTLRYALRNVPPGWRARIWQVFYFAEAICVWAWARRHSVEHLHAHLANVATDDVWLASVFDRLVDPGGSWRWSFTMHGPTEFYAIEQFNLARKVAAADLVVCISDFCRSQLMLLSPPADWDKLVVVHCGADLDRYRYRSRSPQGAPEEALAVLCVGRLVPRKGQAVLLEALTQLGPGVTVTFLGSGPAGADLDEMAERLGVADRVIFAGARGQDDIPLLLDAHDVLCLPSFAEGVPVVLMEAMAAGLPVVATTIAGVPELVTDGVSGLLIPPGRADVLAGALRLLASDPDLRGRLSESGRAVVEAGFDSRKCAAELAALFESRPKGSHIGEARTGSAEQNLLHDL
jgi:colanic acid/amylovoran biosynthesis glycosyltransferase